MASTTQNVAVGTAAGVALLLGALVVFGFVFGLPNEASVEPVADVQCGQIRGTYNSTLKGYSFKGVRYAASPIGNRRWRAPEEMSHVRGTCFEGTYDASDYKDKCAQIDFQTYQLVGSEDCLFLDIYTPSLSGDRPVLVYIHGGSLTGGNSHDLGYSPTLKMAIEMDAVFVSIQYRLGPFGFLVLDELRGRSGNYGLLDAVQALQWINMNIEKFGGDPENVAIFGHSSGGTLVNALMVTDRARGFFQRAWSSSCSPVLRDNYQAAVERNSFFPNRAGCGNATNKEECLVNLGTDVVAWSVQPEWGQTQIYGLPNRNVFDTPFLIVDGDILKVGFRESFQQRLGSVNDVPFMIGSTAQEAEFGPDLPESTPPSLSDWTPTIYRNAVNDALSTFSPSIARQVLNFYNSTDVTLAFTSLVSNVRVNCPSDVLAKSAVEAMDSPVYQYVVTQRPSSPAFGMLNYAFHTWDAFAFFDALELVVYPPSDNDYKLVRMMQNQMRSFLTTGKPADDRWKAVDVNTAIFDNTITFVTNYKERECNYWNSNGFFEYGSIN